MTEFEPSEKEGGEYEKQKGKMPEFIYVESESEEPAGGRERVFQEEFVHSFQLIGEKRFPWSVHLICLILSLFLFLAAAFVSIFVVLFFILNVVTFFQAKEFWDRTKKLWNQFKKVFVTALGTLIGVFSPTFGFSIVLVYLMLQGGSQNEDWAARIIRSSYYD